MSNLRRIVALTVFSTALFPGVASATQWTPPVALQGPLDDLSQPAYPEVAVEVDGEGTATAAWKGRRAGGGYAINVATKPVGGAWSTAETVATTTSSLSDLELAVSKNGRAVVAWIDRRDYRVSAVSAAVRDARGAWSTAEDARQAGGLAYNPAVGIAPAGEALAVWGTVFSDGRFGSPITYDAKSATRPESGPWSLTDLTSERAEGFEVGVDDAGRATLVFSAGGEIKVTTRPVGGVWSVPSTLAPAGEPAGAEGGAASGAPSLPVLAVNAAGDAVVAWSRTVSDQERVQVARRLGGSAFGGVETIASVPVGGRLGGAVDASIDTSGRTSVVLKQLTWVEGASTVMDTVYTSRLLSVSALAGETSWGPAIDVAPPIVTDRKDQPAEGGIVPEFRAVDLEAAGTDQAVVVWSRDLSPGDAATDQPIEAAVRTEGSGWDAPTLLSRSPAVSLTLAAAIDGSGNAHAVWSNHGTILARSVTGTVPTPTPTPTPSPSQARRVNASLTLWPFGASKCPAKIDVRAGAKWAALPAVRVGTGALRCRVTGPVSVASSAKVGSSVPVLATAWGFWPAVAMAKVVAG